MKTYTVSELKAKLSQAVSEVKEGGEILVTEHNRPVAKLVTLGLPALPVGFDLDQICSSSKVRLPKGARSSGELIRELRDEE